MDDDELRSALDTSQTPTPQPRPSRPNSVLPPPHIALPPPPNFTVLAAPDLSPKYHTAPSSPALRFYTPPTSPLGDPHLPSPPALHITIPSSPVHNTDDPFPTADLPIDLALDDDGLSTLEKIYLFSRSKASFHRVFITHALPDFLHQVTPHEAIEYVLPLLSGLAMDEDEAVKEALSSQLVALIWWFFTHCKVSPDDEPAPGHAAAISVQAFTPILGTLLLSPNARVGGGVRYAIVNLLSRLRNADDSEAGIAVKTNEDEDEEEWVTGSFDKEEREMLRNEILQQVVIGMGRLDAGIEDPQVLTDDLDDGQWRGRNAEDHVEMVGAGEQGDGEGVSSQGGMKRARSELPRAKAETVNPYFPVLPLPFPTVSPVSPAGSIPLTGPSSSLSSLAYQPGITPKRGIMALTPTAATTSELNSTLGSGLVSDIDRTVQQVQTAPIEDLLLPSPSSHFTQNSLEYSEVRTTSTAPLMPSSPSEGVWLAQDSSSHASLDRQQTNLVELRYPTAYDIRQNSSENYGSEEEEDEQAAVGRLSSVSLMAAVAASGSLGEEMKGAFVKEVVRVGQDSVYWVRREASFAVGALAKVVPEEVVVCSLLPLFNALRCDPVWHVRHSALFALPAILSRLPPDKRRSLALDTIVALSADAEPTVRYGVLEALGEVIYTFCQDSEGPPEKLIQLFLGRKEDRRVRDGQQLAGESVYDNPERPHICAFNYPAVALTLGKERWPELRELYLDIAANRTMKVRRTLAASLGELAKIIGKENAQRDLVGVWWDAIRSEEEEVRTRAVETVETFLTVVGREVGESMVRGLVKVWDEGVLRGWREREGIAKGLVGLGRGAEKEGRVAVIRLLKRALEDSVAAVREAGVGALAEMWLYLSGHPETADQLRADLDSLAISSLFRRRMTFIACQHAIATHHPMSLDDAFWSPLVALADDPILGVRIGLARLVGSVSESVLADTDHPPSPLVPTLIAHLSHDPSQQVQSYLRYPSPSLHRLSVPKKRLSSDLPTFSRPPPAPALSLPPFPKTHH